MSDCQVLQHNRATQIWRNLRWQVQLITAKCNTPEELTLLSPEPDARFIDNRSSPTNRPCDNGSKKNIALFVHAGQPDIDKHERR